MKKLSKEEKKILKYIKTQINDSFKFLNTKPFKCSMYGLKYIYDNDIEAYRKYEEIYKELSLEDKKKVLSYVIANILEQSKSKEKIKEL